MQLRNRRDVWGFVACVTGLAVMLSQSFNIVVYQIFSDMAPEAFRRKQVLDSLIGMMIALPITFYVGGKIMQMNKMSQELRRLIERDRLTNVSTREYFFDRLGQEPCAGIAMMIDIDHFKRVNDTFGHIAGDEVLRHVAGLLREACRSDDIVSRFGGEEFLVFLPGVERADGASVAERIRRAVAAAPVFVDGRPIVATVSVGVGAKAQSDDLDEAIRVADEALYAAKRGGRNRVELAWALPQADWQAAPDAAGGQTAATA